MRIKLQSENLKVGDNFGGSIKVDLKEIGCGVDWIHLAQNRVQWGGSFEYGNEHLYSIKGGTYFN
jgi:hypothetical protein